MESDSKLTLSVGNGKLDNMESDSKFMVSAVNGKLDNRPERLVISLIIASYC